MICPEEGERVLVQSWEGEEGERGGEEGEGGGEEGEGGGEEGEGGGEEGEGGGEGKGRRVRGSEGKRGGSEGRRENLIKDTFLITNTRSSYKDKSSILVSSKKANQLVPAAISFHCRY